MAETGAEVADPTSIAELRPDPRNARKHTPRNIGMIERALGEVGAARSIVIDEEGTVLAGNGVIEAAANVGMEKLKIVDAYGETIVAVRRRGLTDEQKVKLALYDNRTAELAEWHAPTLEDLTEIVPLGDLFTAKELGALSAKFADPLELTDTEAMFVAPQTGQRTHKSGGMGSSFRGQCSTEAAARQASGAEGYRR